MVYGDTEGSYRKTARLINRIRYQQEEGTPYRTLQENTEKEGSELIDFIEQKANEILKRHDFDMDGCYCGASTVYQEKQAVTISEEKINTAVDRCKAVTATGKNVFQNPVCYEEPEKTVNIAIDDVNVKKQEEMRSSEKVPEKKKRKYVHNTVAYIEKSGDSYTLNGGSVKAALKFLIAFILNNDLLGNRLQFFTDGYTPLNTAIIKHFSWYGNIGIILDWFHLVKKCKELLSMAMNGRDLRNRLLRQVMPLLWCGMTQQAIGLLEKTEGNLIKNQKAMKDLIAYLHRNTPYIPCYALRKELGLKNSSAIGEKMNDLVVADRQKHNGMSWSKKGSVALASMTALKRNKEYERWFEEKDIDFKLAA